MLARIRDRNIFLIDAAIFQLGLAYGISISLVGLFLDARGMSKHDIGTLAVWFALGIVALSLPMGGLIRRFSARATLIASLAGYAATVTAFPFLPGFAGIAAVRFLDGAFSVGVWVSCETILLSRADDTNKAFVTSLYAVSLALGYVLGPFAAKLVVGAVTMQYAFVLSGVIASLAALMVLLRLDPDVPHEDELTPGALSEAGAALSEAGAALSDAGAARAETTAWSLLWRIKTSCFGTFAYGYFQASVVLFLPLYLMESKQITADQTIIILAFFAAGMLLFSNNAGRIGDRRGHLLVMRVLGAIGTLMILGFVFLDAYGPMCVAVFIAGATLASISPVSLALQGVVTARRDLSRGNAIYNAFYASGMLLGPYISARLFDARGGVAMLYHLAALWVGFVVFTIVFYRDDPAVGRYLPAVGPR